MFYFGINWQGGRFCCIKSMLLFIRRLWTFQNLSIFRWIFKRKMKFRCKKNFFVVDWSSIFLEILWLDYFLLLNINVAILQTQLKDPQPFWSSSRKYYEGALVWRNLLSHFLWYGTFTSDIDCYRCSFNEEEVKLVTVVEGNQKAAFLIATTLMCKGGHYSYPRIALLYPWYVPYIAEC